MALDFEFVSGSGARPTPVCVVAREVGSGRVHRLWQDELGAEPPFPVDDDTLFITYFGTAEFTCFLALGWPLPTRVIDLYVEHRHATNGLVMPKGSHTLLGALSRHGISSITSEQKREERELIMGGGPWDAAEREHILTYCQTDVDPLPALLERMLPHILSHPKGLGHALLRGRYVAAAARMEHTGTPLDREMLERLRANWDAMKLDLIEAIDANFHVYERGVWKNGLFAAYLADQGIEWKRTSTGLLRTDQEYFHDMAKAFPQLLPLKELRHAVSSLRLEKLGCGPDDRNRTLLGPFGAKTGRNAPKASEFVFGPAVWLRSLIKPTAGRAVAYLDWSSQEVWIAAYLSGDLALKAVLESGDPYLGFAKMAGLAPADATKESHKEIRATAKVAVLGSNYGQSAYGLATKTGLCLLEAEHVLRMRKQAFPVFTEWSERFADNAQLAGSVTTTFGWTMRTRGQEHNGLRNWPVQSAAAEMLRLACCLATERDIQVCAPVHDALLVEGALESIDDTVAATRAAMNEASRVVLEGWEVPIDVDIVRYPDRYADARGALMWSRVQELLSRLDFGGIG